MVTIIFKQVSMDSLNSLPNKPEHSNMSLTEHLRNLPGHLHKDPPNDVSLKCLTWTPIQDVPILTTLHYNTPRQRCLLRLLPL